MKILFFLIILFFYQWTFALPTQLRELRDDARLAVRKSRCASCHTPSMKPKGRALKIFNLAQKNWSSTMTDANLNRLKTALSETASEDLKARGRDPKEIKLSKSESKIVAYFVTEELKFRKNHPNHRFRDIQRQQNPALYKIIEGRGPNSAEGCVL